MPLTPIDLHTNYASENKRASSSKLDADHAALEAWINSELIPSLRQVIRDDDTLVDEVVRTRNLHPEIPQLFRIAYVNSFTRSHTLWPMGKGVYDYQEGTFWIGNGSTQGGLQASGSGGGGGGTWGSIVGLLTEQTDLADALASLGTRLNDLEYVAPDISGLSNTVGTVEIGSTVTSVTLNWALNKVMTTESIAAPGPGSITPPTLLTYTIGSLSLTAQQAFTVTVGDGTNTDAATTTVYFQHRRRWGASATATPDSALIDALAGAEFSTVRAQSRSMSPSGQYLYFAWPAAWGTPSFAVNGLPVTGWVQTTISYTNPSGNTTSFDVWRSQYLQTGTFSVVVS